MSKKWIGGVLLVLAVVILARMGLYLLEQERSALNQAQSRAVIEQTYAEARQRQTEVALAELPATGEAATTVSAKALYAMALADLPASLEGTSLDGHFRLDSNGRLIVEPGIVRVYEYFMSTLGEEDLATIVKRLKMLIDGALPETARGDAHLLLAQYLDYRDRQGEIADNASLMGADAATLRETFNQLQQLRRDIFGDANASALFAEEEAYTQFNLNTMELNQLNPDMGELEQLQQVRLMAADLPASHREVVEEQLVQRELDLRTRQLQEQGASSEELRLMREQLLGPEAAERLVALDEQRAEWDRRLEQFKKDLDSGLAELGAEPDPEDKEVLIQQLLDAGFDELEQKRVRAIVGLY